MPANPKPLCGPAPSAGTPEASAARHEAGKGPLGGLLPLTLDAPSIVRDPVCPFADDVFDVVRQGR
jgi:hypothetical protein